MIPLVKNSAIFFFSIDFIRLQEMPVAQKIEADLILKDIEDYSVQKKYDEYAGTYFIKGNKSILVNATVDWMKQEHLILLSLWNCRF